MQWSQCPNFLKLVVHLRYNEQVEDKDCNTKADFEIYGPHVSCIIKDIQLVIMTRRNH